MNKTYNFFTDPGHGWLEAPLAEIVDLGIQKDISYYSFLNGETAYLEEDCDAGRFLEAYKAKYGEVPSISEIHTNYDSHVRRYRRFS